MKRFHVHVAVENLEKSIKFYSSIFGTAPTKVKDDYAKWELDEPAINFAISSRGNAIGVNHFGIQVDSESQLNTIAEQLTRAEIRYSSQKGASCCYANSDKHWVIDPSGIAWESFYSMQDISYFGTENTLPVGERSAACCIPVSHQESTAS